MKQPLAKIELVKKMAYPKSKTLTDVSYKEQICIKCNEKYLTQALIENEIDFCPKCEDYRFCEESAEVYHKSEGGDANNGLWFAHKYLKHKCLECDKVMDINQKFCSKICQNKFYIDLNNY